MRSYGVWANPLGGLAAGARPPRETTTAQNVRSSHPRSLPRYWGERRCREGLLEGKCPRGPVVFIRPDVDQVAESAAPIRHA